MKKLTNEMMREKAIEAHKKCCPFLYFSYCKKEFTGINEKTMMKCAYDCPYITSFIYEIEKS